MGRKILGLLAIGAISLACTGAKLHAGEDSLKKELLALNQVTGNEPLRGAMKARFRVLAIGHD